MSAILSLFSPLKWHSQGSHTDDDLIDRLNHSYTAILLTIFAIVVSTKQYVGDPIQCWTPAHFTSAYVDYTNKVCWVSNTYYAPFHLQAPQPEEHRERIVYYQWVPMILLFQAMFFYLPITLWRVFNSKSGVDINGVISAAASSQDYDKRELSMRYVTKNMDRYIGSFRQPDKGCFGAFKNLAKEHCFLSCGRKYGNFLVLLMLSTKLWFVLNAFGQLFLLNTFLGTDFHFYGIDVLFGLMESDGWSGSRRFPRVTMCDFKIRQLTNVQQYSVQCVLPINLFNEKIFIFIWFWMVLVCVMTLLNLLVWLGRSLWPGESETFIKRRLRSMTNINIRKQEDLALLKQFIRNYLRPDGVLILRLLNLNTNDVVTADVMAEIWRTFKENPAATALWTRNNRSEGENEDSV